MMQSLISCDGCLSTRQFENKHSDHSNDETIFFMQTFIKNGCLRIGIWQRMYQSLKRITSLLETYTSQEVIKACVAYCICAIFAKSYISQLLCVGLGRRPVHMKDESDSWALSAFGQFCER